jgi:hypothetical protein
MRGHRTLVFLDDFDDPDTWGYWCADCTEFGFGYTSDIRPGRLASAHEKATRLVLQEAS